MIKPVLNQVMRPQARSRAHTKSAKANNKALEPRSKPSVRLGLAEGVL